MPICKASKEDHTPERNLGRTLAPDDDLLGGENKLTTEVQWNPVNTVTNGPKKLSVLTSVFLFFFYEKMYGSFSRAAQKKVTVLPKWPRITEAGLNCKSSSKGHKLLSY